MGRRLISKKKITNEPIKTAHWVGKDSMIPEN
jgi:hypothetical protein